MLMLVNGMLRTGLARKGHTVNASAFLNRNVSIRKAVGQ